MRQFKSIQASGIQKQQEPKVNLKLSQPINQSQQSQGRNSQYKKSFNKQYKLTQQEANDYKSESTKQKFTQLFQKSENKFKSEDSQLIKERNHNQQIKYKEYRRIKYDSNQLQAYDFKNDLLYQQALSLYNPFHNNQSFQIQTSDQQIILAGGLAETQQQNNIVKLDGMKVQTFSLIYPKKYTSMAFNN